MRHVSGYPYGKTLRAISVGGFTLAEKAYAAGLKLPKHSHEQPYICLVLGGSFTEIYPKRSRSCHPSTVIFNAVGETHSDQFHASTRCFNIEMNSHWLERVGRSRILGVFAEFRGGRAAHLAAGLYREFREVDQFSSLAVEGLALELIAEASRRVVKDTGRLPPRWLKQAKQILHEHFAANPTLISIARSVGVHPVHLARTFRQHYGCTAGEYVRQLRIEFACRELSLSDTPLVEIAAAAGFCSQSHFSTLFKRYTGLTPVEFRSISRAR